jgi:hypothetical protein
MMHKYFVYGPKLFFCASTNKLVTQVFVAQAGGWLTAHQPTKNQVLFPSLSTHPLAPGVQKKSLPGAGGVFLTRGKREVKAPVQSEATAH